MIDVNFVSSFFSEYRWLYVWQICSTFINMVVHTSGAMFVYPITALFVGLQRAIGISAFIFFLTSIHRVLLFRKEIFSDAKNIEVLKWLIPLGAVGAFFGGLFVSYLPVRLLALIIVTASAYFIVQILWGIYNGRHEASGSFTKTGVISIAILAGFLQGGGLPGSDMRNNYLRTIIQEVSVRAVGSVSGLVVFFVSGVVILFHNHLVAGDLIFIVTVTPVLLVAQTYGKRILEIMQDSHAKLLSVSFSIVGITLLANKYLF